ncbi:MAG: helix-turn-helix transcriptional regulator [Lachnospiraceae bacterium]|nr:helix-turn-helix transcriptional regulator [Lachnospiraceae bacterium]
MLRLREIRKNRGLSQSALAKLVGVEQGSLSDLESGKRFPSFGLLIRLAKALECSLDELVDVNADPAAS